MKTRNEATDESTRPVETDHADARRKSCGNWWPVVVSRLLAEHGHRCAGGPASDGYVSEVLNDHLAVAVAIRCDDFRLELLHESDRAHFSMEDFLAIEIERMRERSLRPRWVGPGLAAIECREASAWMLCPEKLAELAGTGNAPVVAVPFTDLALVAAERDAGALGQMADKLEKHANDDAEVVESLRLFRFDGSEWVAWLPAEKRLRRRFRDIAAADLKIQANRQSGLQQVYGSVIPASVHPATVKLVGTIKGDVSTLAVWPPEPVALPRVDAVAFPLPNGVVIAEWKEIQSRFGSLLSPLGTHPQRFLTTGFPTARQIESLKGHVRSSSPPVNFG